MKILLSCPTNTVKPFAHPLTLESIWAQTWPGPVDVLFGVKATDNPSHPYQDINDKYNRARMAFLSSDYDAMFTVEADMVLPPDALSRLIALDTDVAYGLYCSRHNRGDGHPYRWLAFQYASDSAAISWSQHPRKTVTKLWGKASETHGLGFGCTLIKRHVIEAFPFRAHPTHEVSDDWMFSLDCQANGFIQMHDFGCICGHILNDNQRAVWPDIDAPNLYSIRELDNGISNNPNTGDTQEKASLRPQTRVGYSWAGQELHAG